MSVIADSEVVNNFLIFLASLTSWLNFLNISNHHGDKITACEILTIFLDVIYNGN